MTDRDRLLEDLVKRVEDLSRLITVGNGRPSLLSQVHHLSESLDRLAQSYDRSEQTLDEIRESIAELRGTGAFEVRRDLEQARTEASQALGQALVELKAQRDRDREELMDSIREAIREPSPEEANKEKWKTFGKVATLLMMVTPGILALLGVQI